MKLSDVCFFSAALAIVSGMAMGLHMGIAQDFTLAPAHAHLNLLGWVTMALMGLYYRGTSTERWVLARVQVGLALFGFWAMPAGLGVLLSTGSELAETLVALGSVSAFAAMVLFLAIVVRAARISARTEGHDTAPVRGLETAV